MQHKTAEFETFISHCREIFKSFSSKTEKIEFQPQKFKKTSNYIAREQDFFDLVYMSSKVIAKCLKVISKRFFGLITSNFVFNKEDRLSLL